jgi:hypothetical protein
MFKNNRISYFILVVITIILGILSRKIDGIPTYFGDTLYAVMIYFGMRFIFVNHNKNIAIIFALFFCYSIEFQQIYRADWIVQIRRTSLGHYVLGQGFLWSDLVFYTIGVFVAYLADSVLIKTPNTNLK